MGIEDTPREQIPWYPEIIDDSCTGCGSCYDFCPHDTYEWDEEADRPVVANPYNCVVGCSNCRAQCPEEAISFPPLSMLEQFR